MPEFVDKWVRIGLCTDPADRSEAEEGVRLSYRIAGLDPPEKIVWCGSPFSFPLDSHSLTNSVCDSIMFVRASVRDWIRALLSRSAGDSVADSVRRRVEAVVFALRGDYINRDAICGRNDAGWYAYYEFFRVVCGLCQETEKMLGMMQVAENAGWWLPHEDICWVSERPNRLIRDDRGRPHCEDGPALTYPDGTSVYSIHGVLLTEQVVMSPRTQSVEEIRIEFNAEVKRIRIERFGWGEYLRAVGAVVIDTRDNDVETTKEALMKTPDGHVVLVCACPSTSRVYCLEVPPTVTTCEAAQDWLSGGLSRRVINGA